MFVGLEVCVIFLCAAGIGLLCWLAMGRARTPVGQTGAVYAIVVATGDGEGLEGELGGILWLANQGWYRGKIIIAYNNLTHQGQQRVATLMAKYQGMTLCPLEALTPYLTEIE